ncbi:hypothetical protein FSP39_008872 [Pinctada imbricata]|uniref:Galactosylceramide sulfotransferase n=1 Tax=Pinctada imbricata TaxID=66713 RepID=A0AA88YLB2_PINIB|nr:hypothetical protein FSP39_008872 [Pinctada imbricata]
MSKRAGLSQTAYQTNGRGKQNHLYFLRTHKSGSTTIYSLFLRFGYRNNLTFVLPAKFNSTTISIVPFQKGKGYLGAPKGEKYEILCHHTVYNRTGLAGVLPIDTMYIGLVREPLAHFVSAFIYFKYKFKKKFLVELPGDDVISSITWYLNNPKLVLPRHTDKNIRQWVHTKNGMAYDFGYPVELIEYGNSIETYEFIERLDSEFDLVLVLEYLDESLVLMKRMLAWSMKDILYITYNNKGIINSTHVKNLLTEGEIQRHREWESVDFALYNHFKDKLLRRIQNEGMSFHNEVQDFKEARHAVGQFCYSMQTADEELHFLAKNSNEEFTINFYDCKMLKTIGRDFLPLLKGQKHYRSLI